MTGLIAWLIPKVKDGETDDQIWIDYLADPRINHTNNAEATVRRQARAVREILRKAEILITEDLDRATRLLSQIEKENDLEIAIKSYDIKDVNGLRVWANLSDEEWECYSQTVRASQNKKTPWFIVEGKFRKRQPGQFTIEELAKKAQNIIENYKPQPLTPVMNIEGDKLLEISLPDLHMGNMNYTDTETLETSSKKFKDAVCFFTDECSHKKLDEIVFTVGSDFFTINADKNETKKGTPQDLNCYYDKLYEVGLETAIDCIEHLRKHARKVTVVGVLGNHDEQSAVWLMLALNKIFRSADNVTVDYKYNQRKYMIFGSTAIAFVHKLRKKLEALPILMLQEMIEQGLISKEIKYYEIHGGDTHVPEKHELPAETTNQKITQRVLSSLTDNSRWAHDNFGQKVVEGQAFLYDKNKGIQNVMVYRP